MNNNLIQQYSIKVWCQCAAFLQDKKGASGIEYAIIATMVAVVIALFVGSGENSIGDKITGVFNSIFKALPVPTGD